MLKKLTVKNVALISYLELEFCGGLNILSGETGAGKSIVVDSLMLILGMRYDKSLLKFGTDSGYAEGVFQTPKAGELLGTLNIDDDGDLIIISRKFNNEGKNEIRVNGKQITTSMLKTFAATLVDIYGQHEYQSLLRPSEHLKILDYYARHSICDSLEQLSGSYARYKAVCEAISSLGDLQQREREIDLLKYQINEIGQSKLYENEEEDLVAKRRAMLSFEKINTALNECCNIFSSSSKPAVLSMLSDIKHHFNSLSQYSPEYLQLFERINSSFIELDDIASTVQSIYDGMCYDERELDLLEKRLSEVRSLRRKYGDYAAMNKFLNTAKERLYILENGAEQYDKYCLERSELLKYMYNQCVELSTLRKTAAKQFEKSIIEQLNELGMEQARFEINFNAVPDIGEFESCVSANGFDSPEYYLSPNAGQPLMPLIKIISGGEISRFMLALKIISSHNEAIPTLIFDEIDTGISGAVGQAVAKRLARLARSHQVICVTHLPQIASMADNHYFISKHINDGETFTSVRLLDEGGEIEEISRLSGAKDISSKSAQNAVEMKQWSKNYKKSLN